VPASLGKCGYSTPATVFGARRALTLALSSARPRSMLARVRASSFIFQPLSHQQRPRRTRGGRSLARAPVQPMGFRRAALEFRSSAWRKRAPRGARVQRTLSADGHLGEASPDRREAGGSMGLVMQRPSRPASGPLAP